MGTKKKVLLYIDAETIKTAKELGLNLSKVSENALKDAIRRMKDPNPEIMHNGGTEIGGKWTGGIRTQMGSSLITNPSVPYKSGLARHDGSNVGTNLSDPTKPKFCPIL